MPTPAHILELRALIGTQLLLVPSVTAAIFETDAAGGAGHEPRLLVVRITARDDEFWTFPGGLLEPDERPREGVVREALEETGLEVCVSRVLDTFGGPEFRHVHANGDETAYVMTTYLCDVVGGELLVDGEGDEIAAARWVTRDEALALPSGPWFPIVVRAAFDAHAASDSD
ncbi:MAG: hydrolase [Thermoleophilia bacterium]|nr:hydrolase [Thermoleophilia bacterium]